MTVELKLTHQYELGTVHVTGPVEISCSCALVPRNRSDPHPVIEMALIDCLNEVRGRLRHVEKYWIDPISLRRYGLTKVAFLNLFDDVFRNSPATIAFSKRHLVKRTTWPKEVLVN